MPCHQIEFRKPHGTVEEIQILVEEIHSNIEGKNTVPESFLTFLQTLTKFVTMDAFLSYRVFLQLTTICF